MPPSQLHLSNHQGHHQRGSVPETLTQLHPPPVETHLVQNSGGDHTFTRALTLSISRFNREQPSPSQDGFTHTHTHTLVCPNSTASSADGEKSRQGHTPISHQGEYRAGGHVSNTPSQVAPPVQNATSCEHRKAAQLSLHAGDTLPRPCMQAGRREEGADAAEEEFWINQSPSASVSSSVSSVSTVSHFTPSRSPLSPYYLRPRSPAAPSDVPTSCASDGGADDRATRRKPNHTCQKPPYSPRHHQHQLVSVLLLPVQLSATCLYLVCEKGSGIRAEN